MEAIEFVFVVISHPSMLCFTLAKAANFSLLSLDTVEGKQLETRIINSLLCVIVLDFVALASFSPPEPPEVVWIHSLTIYTHERREAVGFGEQ